jgi:hypothetical protein
VKDDPLAAIAVTQAEQGDWSVLQARLAQGWERPRGIRLTRHECKILYEILQGTRKRPRGRQAKPAEVENKARHLATYSLLLELDGEPTEAAVAATERTYGVTRSAVYAARKQHCPRMRMIGLDEGMNPEQRKLLRKWFEARAPLFWSNKFVRGLG